MAKGIRAIILFGVSEHKDECGSDTWNDDGLMARMIRTAKVAAPDMLVISDNCFVNTPPTGIAALFSMIKWTTMQPCAICKSRR